MVICFSFSTLSIFFFCICSKNKTNLALIPTLVFRLENWRDKATRLLRRLSRSPARLIVISAQRFRIYQMNVGGAWAIKRKQERRARDKPRLTPSCVKRRRATLIYLHRCLLIGRVVTVPVNVDNWIIPCKIMHDRFRYFDTIRRDDAPQAITVVNLREIVSWRQEMLQMRF